MTIHFIDVPPPVAAWYAEKADEMGMGTLELMAHVLTLYPVTVTRPRQPGAFISHDHTIPAYDEPTDFPSGAGY